MLPVSHKSHSPTGASTRIGLIACAALLIVSSLLPACGGGKQANKTTSTTQQPPDLPQQVTPPPDNRPSYVLSATQVTPIDDFQSPETQWSFANGSEFPGASGSLTYQHDSIDPGERYAQLNVDLSCTTSNNPPALWSALSAVTCGKYVAMTKSFPTPISAPTTPGTPALIAAIKNEAGNLTPTFRVVDSTGQTLQYKAIARNIEIDPASPQDWTTVMASLTTSKSFWGGAADGQPHWPLRSVSLVAGGQMVSTPISTMLVDEVNLLNTADFTFNLKTEAPLSGRSFFPTYVGHLGVAFHARSNFAPLDKAAAAGITLVRTDLNWQGVESAGQFNFDRYNAIQDEIERRSMSTLWILDYGHPDHGGATPLSDADQTAFATFGARAASNFAGRSVLAFEVWNEPNIPGFWPSPDANAYSRLFVKTKQAIAAASPSTKVITSGLASVDIAYLSAMLDWPGVNTADAIALHPYRQSNPETYAAELSMIQTMLTQRGITAPIWDSEWGYSTIYDLGTNWGTSTSPTALRRQGIIILRKVLTHMALNTPVHILYDLSDDGTDPTNREHHFGLLTTDGQDKPSMTALKTLYAIQTGRTFKGFLPQVPHGLHALRWDANTDRAFAVWLDTPDRTATVVLPRNVKSITRWDGTTMLPTTTSFTLTEADGPVFITINL